MPKTNIDGFSSESRSLMPITERLSQNRYNHLIKRLVQSQVISGGVHEARSVPQAGINTINLKFNLVFAGVLEKCVTDNPKLFQLREYMSLQLAQEPAFPGLWSRKHGRLAKSFNIYLQNEHESVTLEGHT